MYNDRTRENQAYRLYERFRGVLGCNFGAYLNGTDALEAIPQIPIFPGNYIRHFGENVCLVDWRIVDRVGLKEYLRLCGLLYSGEDDTLEPISPEAERTGASWMIYQDGFRNYRRKPSECRRTYAPFEVDMVVVAAASIYVQDPTVVNNHCMCIPGTKHRHDDIGSVYLKSFSDGPRIYWVSGDDASPQSGPATRGK